MALSDRPGRRHPVIGTMLAWTGGGLLLFCLWLVGDQWQFMRSHERAQGEVLSAQRWGSSSGKFTRYTLQVRFDTPRGRVTATTGPGLSQADPGDAVTVYYRADQPSGISTYSFLTFWFAPLVVGAVGALLLLAGIELIRRPRPKAAAGTARRAPGPDHAD